MLILPEAEMKRQHEDAKSGLTNHFNNQMEKIINEFSHIDKYWILGKVKFPDEFSGRVAHAFLKGCLEKPPLVAESFLYEVDNRAGNKTLLWVMHPDKTLSLPTIGKTIKPSNVVRKKGR